MKASRVVAGLLLFAALSATAAPVYAAADQFAPAQPPEGITKEEYSVAVVQQVIDEVRDDAYGYQHSTQRVTMRMLDGSDAGMTFSMSNGILANRDDMRLKEGQQVIIDRKIGRAHA